MTNPRTIVGASHDRRNVGDEEDGEENKEQEGMRVEVVKHVTEMLKDQLSTPSI
ncbi:hypothetical protein HanIR_Chr17g0883801 [Helianthus annuus]|nr:hypothetical protein HanIR_Chr17g0883801 [Helianthus annuus]